ncbi:MAG: FAD-dependent oxidoreductase [Acidobacteria bacterium]|nr:MAG: FAD-dependent oxidoreductase [Acidobacteriota bacterium]PYR19148.1 MAG: FAD-dependent oxidoreductase [Acidobacteriota bacterium]
MNPPHVVILGGGFAGLHAARALDGAAARVTLLDRHNYHLFQPLLYQVATASLSPGDVASPIRWILRHQKNVQVLLAAAREIDPIGRRVILDHDSLSYDYLVVATGSAHAYFGHPEWAERAPGLKTLDDALEMRRRVLLAFEAAERETDPEKQQRLLTFVIVGAGPTGVELAGALAEIARQSLVEDFRSIRPESARIVLIEGSPHVLGPFPDPLRAAARQALERLGIEVKTESVVVDIDADGVTCGVRSRAPGSDPGARPPEIIERIAAETVLWAAGVAASPLAKTLGVPLDRVGRVTPEPTLALAAHPGIFVVGDICAFVQDGKPLPGVAQVAMQQGARAGRNIRRAIQGQGLEPFRYHDYGIMATIGRGSAVGDVFGLKISGFFAWLFWIFLHIFWLIGFRNRFVVMTEWAWAYFSLQRRVRLITGERDAGPSPARR